MPPRFAYWTILIDGKPTAFRAREQDELLPTFGQLKRKNADVVLRWFARGRLWDSPEAERIATRAPKKVEKRAKDWRPGGDHKDPRQHWRDQKQQRNQERRAERHEGRIKGTHPGKRFDKPPDEKPWSTRPTKPWREKPPRRDADRPPKPAESPDSPPIPEQIVKKPEPPERG